MREIEGAGSPIKPNRKATGRFEELQVLRGYAASMVVIVHCIAAWQPLAERDEFSRTAADVLLIPISGRAPVILFFVLSGFVLTHSLLNSQGGRWSIVAFYVRRLFRIMPAAIAGLVLMILAAEFARRTVPSWANQADRGFFERIQRSAAGGYRISAVDLEQWCKSSLLDTACRVGRQPCDAGPGRTWIVDSRDKET